MIRFQLATALLATLLLGPAVPSVQAQDTGQSVVSPSTLGERAPYRIILNHVDGSVELHNSGGRVLEKWDRYAAAPVAEIPHGRPVEVVVTNANPLLYNYDVRVNIIREEEVKSCKDIAGRFVAQGFLLGAAAVTGTAAFPGFEGGEITAGFLDVNAVLSAMSPGTRGAGLGTLSESELQQQLSQIRAEVNSFVDYAVLVSDLGGSVEDSLTLFAVKGESVPLEGVLNRYQQSLERLQPGLSDPTRTPVLVDQRIKRAAPSVGTLNSLANAIQQGLYAGRQSDPEAREALLLKFKVDDGISRLEQSYPVLQRGLLLIERTKAGTSRVFNLAASQGTVREIVITRSSNGQRENVFRVHEGELSVYTRPFNRLRCELSLGLTWMDPIPNYELDRTDSTLVNSNKDDFRIAPSLMVHFSHASVPFMGVSFGAGIGKFRAPDLYLGGSLRLFEPILINLGVAWQRQPDLPLGLAEGSVLGESDLDFFDDPDLVFRRTFYMGISVGR